jgi:peptidoglycan hydrolase-like protein with peptidoglycan-binding domain
MYDNIKNRILKRPTIWGLFNMAMDLGEIMYLLITGTADGIYGDGSKGAVKAFQKRRGLTVDGQVGKKTYLYLSFAAY